MPAAKNLRTCNNGHTYYKSSSCPVCPVCEREKIPAAAFLALLSAPARRALENKNIDTLEKLSSYSVKDLLTLHGLGQSSIPKLKQALKEEGLSFRKE